MHAHTCALFIAVRTTIEIKDEYRAKLLKVAAERGEKGFSAIVEEALALYLNNLSSNHKVVDRACRVLGSLSDDEAKEMKQRVLHSRKNWR